MDAIARREQLVALFREMKECHDCPLADSRTNVVFGAGNANADLMFVGEAPGAHEDLQGLPFVGRAGKLLDQLLDEVGFRRQDVFIANVLKCLRYTAQVQLSDGSWERIGRLVRSKYSGEVMSVDADGHLVPRRVTGWHATPLAGRSVFRLHYASAKNAGLGRVGIELTGDHPVLTERGYVSVDKLQSSDRIATGQGLTAMARDVVCGTLLGDGSLNAASAHLSIGHSSQQRDYAVFKADLLAELSPRVRELDVAAVVGGPKQYGVVHMRTLAHRSLGILRRDFYGPGRRKIVPAWLADQLNDRMLAIWFMDDGHTRIREGGRRPLAELATDGFGDDDRRALVRALERLGLPAQTARGRLFFNVTATRELARRIAPYVPPSMRYKLHPEVESTVQFDQKRYVPGAPEVLFDEVDVADVTNRPRGDTTFFCIDVEDTHNFVTAGGVVHNCRPPGNRDPLPDEIDACKPYLYRQIELIEPRVVCTLGNFATKLLTRSSRGIMSVRGKPQAHELGGRWVHVYPLLHPAAALRTPRTLDALRDDFRGLPGLLEQPPPRPPGAPPPARPSGGEALPEPVAASQLDLFG